MARHRPPPWEDLPELCWEAVLRSLRFKEDLESVSSVCKRLPHISDTVRTSLYIRNHMTPPGLESLLSRRFTSLKYINLGTYRGDRSYVLLQIAQFPLPLDCLDLSNQESLRLDGLREMGSRFGSLRVMVLANIGLLEDVDLGWIADYFPTLEELDIRHPRLSRVTDDGIKVLSQKLQRLLRIDVSGNRSLSDQSLVVLSVNLPCLREVGFTGCDLITGRGIAKLIKNRPNLISLAPTFMEKETIFCEELVDSFRRAQGLSSLDFSGSFIWDELLMSVAEANIPLERLVLWHASGFSFDGIQKIMLKHRGIKVLDLEKVDFLTDRDMSLICRGLHSLTSVNISDCFNLTKTTLYNLTRQCPLLKRIDMERTNLRMDDANETDIVVNSQVGSLSIANNVNLTNECLKKIGRMFPNLWYLDVGGNCLKITGDGISIVLKSCPEIKHLVIHGLENIGNLCIDFELPHLECLQATFLKLSDKQLVAFISRCCHVKRLDLRCCVHLLTKGVETMVKNCKTLREINLTFCHKVRHDVPFLDWMASVRPSLRKIVPPRGLVPFGIRHFLHRGCLVCDY